MKKEVENAIIATESEEIVNNLIWQLVNETQKIGVDKFKLLENILDIWDKTEDQKRDNKSLPQKEQEFANKVTKFLEYYKYGLCYTYIEYWKNIYAKTCVNLEAFESMITNESVINPLIKSHFQTLTSMYAIFNQKKHINLKNINSFEKRFFNIEPHQETSSQHILYLYNFFYLKLNFNSENNLPTFTKYDSLKNSLSSCSQFKIFEKIYSKNCKKSNTFKVAIAAIWFIDKYF